MSVQIKFSTAVSPGDPESRPCTIVGKRPNLTKVPFTAIAPLLGNRVSEEVHSLSHVYTHTHLYNYMQGKTLFGTASSYNY